MARDSFLLRVDPQILAAIRQWSDDDLRSVNAQIEFLLRQSLKNAGRLPKAADSPADASRDPPPKSKR